MNKKEISLIINGKDANAASDEIKKILKDEFGYDVQITAEKEHYPGERTRSVDPVAVGALILAIPATILTVLQLKDRLSKKEQLDRAFEKIDKQVVRKKEIPLRIQYPDGMIKEISAVDTVEILDIANK